MLLIKNAEVYAPEYLGKKDVLIAGGLIEAVESCGAFDGLASAADEVIEGEGLMLFPGIVDGHVHITGGGGEGGFKTRAPEIMLSDMTAAGVTTVLGLLGTDDMTRSTENLVAKAKALRDEGISAYALTGAYGYPSVTLTGSIKKDIVFISEIMGLKLALSDHRAPNVTTEELIRLASDVRTAGMIAGKESFIVLHMGDGKDGLKKVFEALERTEIPIKVFHPTHVSRCENLFSDAIRFAKMGGRIDITAFDSRHSGDMEPVLERLVSEGVNLDRVSISSDAQGSYSEYDSEGRLIKIGISPIRSIYDEFAFLMKESKLKKEDVLSLFTKNPADAMGLFPKKGAIKKGSDADIILTDKNMVLKYVIACGKPFMKDGSIVKRGTFEPEKDLACF